MVIPFLCLVGLVGLLFLLPPGEDSSSTPTHSTSTICHSHYVPRPQYRCYKHAHYR
ncbi:hypothetical protein KP509_34G065700 [Ceratopteris richardii]|nr:hypothetical protein KP509_34G065700 [Ceratopteris richardii]